jgi:hypothetical protein
MCFVVSTYLSWSVSVFVCCRYNSKDVSYCCCVAVAMFADPVNHRVHPGGV